MKRRVLPPMFAVCGCVWFGVWAACLCDDRLTTDRPDWGQLVHAAAVREYPGVVEEQSPGLNHYIQPQHQPIRGRYRRR